MKLHFILTGEGSSDLRLVNHIENILVNEGFVEVSGEAPDLSMFRIPVGRTVREKVSFLIRLYPDTDLIFYHRDADGAGRSNREEEIMSVATELNVGDRVIPVIPVSMLETWLLSDLALIRAVAGKPNATRAISCLPNIRDLESVPDAKRLLQDVLCEASETEGGRLRKFKRRFHEMRARLTNDLDPEGPVNSLPSYQYFRQKIREYVCR